MKTIAIVLAALSFFLTACIPSYSTPTTPTPGANSSAKATSTAIATSTPVAAPTEAPTQTTTSTLRSFARLIDEAVSDEDTDALVALTRETRIDCQKVTEPGPSCPEGTLGTIRKGIPIGLYASEYSLITIAEYREFLSDFFMESRHIERDDYGTGTPWLFDLRCPVTEPIELEAVVTSIGQAGRIALLLRAQYRQREWAISAVVVVLHSFIDDVLVPGPSCLDLE